MGDKKARFRPLSPHLTIYKPQITSVLSITHRGTGVFLSIGTLVLAWWLIALALGPSAYAIFYEYASSLVGKLLLIAWAFSIYYHLLNGIRHLFWDFGFGFELPTVTASGWLVVIMSGLLTLITWHAAYSKLGWL